jgi:hypothetical protein
MFHGIGKCITPCRSYALLLTHALARSTIVGIHPARHVGFSRFLTVSVPRGRHWLERACLGTNRWNAIVLNIFA